MQHSLSSIARRACSSVCRGPCITSFSKPSSRCGVRTHAVETPSKPSGLWDSNSSSSVNLRSFTSQPTAQATCSTSTAETEMLGALESVMGPLDSTPLRPPPAPVVVVISGPSGVGKDAVIDRLKQQRPDLYFVVTATSRARRPAEVEGRDYFFVDKPQFEAWRDGGMLLEHALVYGEYKGIPRQQVDTALSAGTDVVLRIDVQGAATVRSLMPSVISIFITAESEQALVMRLIGRKTDPLDRMIVRAQTARKEMQCIPDFDYVVLNEDGKIDQCVAEISSIIAAEKARVR